MSDYLNWKSPIFKPRKGRRKNQGWGERLEGNIRSLPRFPAIGRQSGPWRAHARWTALASRSRARMNISHGEKNRSRSLGSGLDRGAGGMVRCRRFWPTGPGPVPARLADRSWPNPARLADRPGDVFNIQDTAPQPEIESQIYIYNR